MTPRQRPGSTLEPRSPGRAEARPDGPTAGLQATLAAHAERDPFFTAAALAAYRARHRLDENALAAWLGCGLEALHRLALRQRPRTAQDIARLAAYAGVDARRLGEVLREA